MAAYEDAVQELAQVPLPQFIAERKRLAGELKAAGDAAAAKQLAARKRPTISVWVVNQLYWHARDAFDDLLATAEKLRTGDLKASAAHRDAIARLRSRAATMLEDAGHAPTEATLRRVTTTLSAIAVEGGFAPDLPGALADDRDPPGFAAFGIPPELGDSVPATPTPTPTPTPRAAIVPPAARTHTDGSTKDDKNAKDAKHDKHDKSAKDDKDDKNAAKAREAAAAAQRAAEMAEKKAAEAERKRIAAERHRLEAALRTAKGELHEREREVTRLEKQLAAAQDSVEDARSIVDDLNTKLAELDEGN